MLHLVSLAHSEPLAEALSPVLEAIIPSEKRLHGPCISGMVCRALPRKQQFKMAEGHMQRHWACLMRLGARSGVREAQFRSVQFSHSVVSDSLRPHGLQRARPPCPSPTPGAYSNLCPLSRWCHPTISVIPFSSCPQSFPASRSFQMSQFFASGGQRIGVSASPSVLPMNIQDWSPLGWTGWISLQSKGLSKVFSNTKVQKHQFFGSAFFILQLLHPYMTTGKTIALTRRTFVGKVMSLLFNMLSRLVITFLPRSKSLLISWLQSPSAVILEPPKNKAGHCFPFYLPWSDGARCRDLRFLNVEL